ncbi:protein FAM185A [Aulostomus maculatus]
MFRSVAALRGGVGLLRSRSLSVSPGSVTFWCPLHPSRSLYVSAVAKSAVTPTHGDVTRHKQWVLDVSPFSTVRAQLGCSISVTPLDLHAFPEANRAFITVHGADPKQEASLDHFHVHYDEQGKELLISAEKVTGSVSVELAAPIKCNLFISTQGPGNVHVKKMECEICKVQTERGACTLHSVKAHQVHVQSRGGSVTGVGTIHGNVDISTLGDGVVDVKKLQGTKMNVSTEHGALRVRAIYAESSRVSSRSGKVELGHVHGSAVVKNVSGDTLVGGSNSFLQVSSHSGAIDVYVGDGGSADLQSQEGAVCVRVPSSLRSGVELSGASVIVSPEVPLLGVETNATERRTTVTGYLNTQSPADQWVKVQADRGGVTLRTQSWFESLKLGG